MFPGERWSNEWKIPHDPMGDPIMKSSLVRLFLAVAGAGIPKKKASEHLHAHSNQGKPPKNETIPRTLFLPLESWKMAPPTRQPANPPTSIGTD
jgi:hypothetical protein